MGPAGSPRAPCAGMLAKKGHTCKQEAFATRLEERVNAQWPCATAHKVTNLCQRAKGSNFFANWAAAWPNDEALTSLAQADVVVVETALNDMSETEGGILLSGRLTGWTRSTVDMVGYWTELLLRVLLSLPRRPALLWLTASWTPTKQPPYHRDAEAAHHAVLRHYGVAQLSMLGALGIENSASAREWAKQQYHTDRYSHVSALGHKLLAAVISHHLTTELHREMRPTNAGSAVTPGALPLPMIVDEARIRAYTSSAHRFYAGRGRSRGRVACRCDRRLHLARRRAGKARARRHARACSCVAAYPRAELCRRVPGTAGRRRGADEHRLPRHVFERWRLQRKHPCYVGSRGGGGGVAACVRLRT